MGPEGRTPRLSLPRRPKEVGNCPLPQARFRRPLRSEHQQRVIARPFDASRGMAARPSRRTGALDVSRATCLAASVLLCAGLVGGCGPDGDERCRLAIEEYESTLVREIERLGYRATEIWCDTTGGPPAAVSAEDAVGTVEEVAAIVEAKGWVAPDEPLYTDVDRSYVKTISGETFELVLDAFTTGDLDLTIYSPKQ